MSAPIGMLLLVMAMAQPAAPAPFSPGVFITADNHECQIGELIEISERLVYDHERHGDELAKIRECRDAMEAYSAWQRKSLLEWPSNNDGLVTQP